MTVRGQNTKSTFVLSAITNYATIVVSLLVGLISVPFGLSYFGPIRYGVWLVIRSILAYLRISDFGIGLSTLTLIAQTSDSSHHRVILRRSISLLSSISFIFVVIIFVVSRIFPKWGTILGEIPSNLQEEITTAALSIFILVLFQLPTTIITSAFSGLQQVHWNRVYNAFHSIVTLGALIVTILTNGNLVTLAIFTGLGSILVGVVSGFHLFLAHPNVRPRIFEKVKDAPSNKILFNSGMRFLTLQIAVLIIWNTDNLVITHCVELKAVTPYAITFKLFQMGLMLVRAPIIALWPMYGRAFGAGDWHWLHRTYNRSTLLQIIPGGLFWIGGIIFSQAVINLWAGPAGYGGFVVAFALGGYVYISSFGGSNSSLINGLNPTNIIVFMGIIEAVLNLGISLILVGPLGIGGVALGTFLATLAINTWFPPLYIQRRTQKRVNLELKPVLTHTIVVVSCVTVAIFAALYLPLGLLRFVVGIVIIAVYLILSWRVIPSSIRNLIKDKFSKLRSVRSFPFIRYRR